MLQLLDMGPASDTAVRSEGSKLSGMVELDLRWMMNCPYGGDPFIERDDEDGLLRQTERGRVLSVALGCGPVQTLLLRLMKPGRGYHPMEFHRRRNMPRSHLLEAFRKFEVLKIITWQTVEGVRYACLTEYGEQVKDHIPDE